MKIGIIVISILLLFVIGSIGGAEDKGHMAVSARGAGSAVTGFADVKMHQSCPHCGMDRDKFSHSRMLIVYADGVTVGTCSIHCAATELKASKTKMLKSAEVADYNSRKLVNADTAVWVIGGNKRGVMTRTAKWAFANRNDALTFVKQNGGQVSTYSEALSLAEKE